MRIREDNEAGSPSSTQEDAPAPMLPARRLKLLIYGINYEPEITGIGKYTGDMARWLAARGHDVRVVTAPPYYPEWKVHDGYRASQYSRVRVAGVDVFRAPLWVPERVTGLRRLIHLSSFALASIPSLLRQWHWRPDVVWMAAPPLMCAPAALAFAGLRGATSWLHIQDYEVDAAFELGMLKGKTLRSMCTWVECKLFGAFGRVSTISNRMLDRARAKGVREAKLLSLPNWADISGVRPLTQVSEYRDELNIPHDAIVALYSGNMGGKQGLEVLGEVAEKFSGNSHVHFVFCGAGSSRDALVAQCDGMANVHFLDLQPLERLPQLLGLADIHLLPQRADAADLVMPSKLTGMLSSGRPAIAGARDETELAQVVATCGLVVTPEDAQAFADAISRLADDQPLRQELGSNARQWAERHLDRDAVLAGFEAELLRVVAARPSRRA